MYSLMIIIFMASGVHHYIPVKSNMSYESCIDNRDNIRGRVEYLNDPTKLNVYNGTKIEFLEVECNIRKSFI